MIRYLIIFFFLINCSQNKEVIQKKFKNSDFSNDLTFEEFKEKLNEYAENQPYPNIDN